MDPFVGKGVHFALIGLKETPQRGSRTHARRQLAQYAAQGARGGGVERQ